MKHIFVGLLLPLALCLNLGCNSNVEVTKSANTEPTTNIEDAAKSQPESPSTERLDANVVLQDAIASAKSQNKNVFVHLGAPW